jgi:AmiR/NasT family two-component response regulator
VAIGILMARQLVTHEEAFAQLVTVSQHLNRKLRDIAAEVEETGAVPHVPERRHPRPGPRAGSGW